MVDLAAEPLRSSWTSGSGASGGASGTETLGDGVGCALNAVAEALTCGGVCTGRSCSLAIFGAIFGAISVSISVSISGLRVVTSGVAGGDSRVARLRTESTADVPSSCCRHSTINSMSRLLVRC